MARSVRRRITAIKEKAREDGVELLIGLAGVQSNQYPRGRDLALQFVAHGLPTIMGGFHVSGYPQSREFMHSCGISTAVGEAENFWGEVIQDFLDGKLKPEYSVNEGIRAKTGTGDILVPVITDAQLPLINERYLTRFFNDTQTTMDTSRGCPFTCSYCSVKNVMGRTMRSRDPQSVVQWVRDAVFNHGIDSLFLVDDDFFRSPRWDEILTGMAQIRKEFPKLSFMMQVDVDASCYANVGEGEKPGAKHRAAGASWTWRPRPDATRPSSGSNRSIRTISTTLPSIRTPTTATIDGDRRGPRAGTQASTARGR